MNGPKDGKCFGQLCRGCVKHECEVNGHKTILNPPEEYTQQVLASGFQPNETVSATINVEDRPELSHERKWCTRVPNKREFTFETECIRICAEFGHAICLSVPIEIAPTSDCKEVGFRHFFCIFILMKRNYVFLDSIEINAYSSYGNNLS